MVNKLSFNHEMNTSVYTLNLYKWCVAIIHLLFTLTDKWYRVNRQMNKQHKWTEKASDRPNQKWTRKSDLIEDFTAIYANQHNDYVHLIDNFRIEFIGMGNWPKGIWNEKLACITVFHTLQTNSPSQIDEACEKMQFIAEIVCFCVSRFGFLFIRWDSSFWYFT